MKGAVTCSKPGEDSFLFAVSAKSDPVPRRRTVLFMLYRRTVTRCKVADSSVCAVSPRATLFPDGGKFSLCCIGQQWPVPRWRTVLFVLYRPRVTLFPDGGKFSLCCIGQQWPCSKMACSSLYVVSANSDPVPKWRAVLFVLYRRTVTLFQHGGQFCLCCIGEQNQWISHYTWHYKRAHSAEAVTNRLGWLRGVHFRETGVCIRTDRIAQLFKGVLHWTKSVTAMWVRSDTKISTLTKGKQICIITSTIRRAAQGNWCVQKGLLSELSSFCRETRAYFWTDIDSSTCRALKHCYIPEDSTLHTCRCENFKVYRKME
jgi:hypothetical protein